jgi:hypothetical protein
MVSLRGISKNVEILTLRFPEPILRFRRIFLGFFSKVIIHNIRFITSGFGRDLGWLALRALVKKICEKILFFFGNSNVTLLVSIFTFSGQLLREFSGLRPNVGLWVIFCYFLLGLGGFFGRIFVTKEIHKFLVVLVLVNAGRQRVALVKLIIHFFDSIFASARGVKFSRKFLIGARPWVLLRGLAENVIKISNIALSGLTHGFLILHKEKNYLDCRRLACTILSW